MSRSAMLIAAGATLGVLLSACSDDAPTANPVTHQERTVAQAPTVRPDIVVASTVSACVNNSSGTIKIVSAGSSCAGNELALTLATGSGSASVITGHEVVSSIQFIPPGPAVMTASCPVGKKVLGAGYTLDPDQVRVYGSYPGDANQNVINNGWVLFLQNLHVKHVLVQLHMTCANAE